MLGPWARHSLLAVPLAVLIEELGIPMPIPTDVLIVFLGTTAGGSIGYLAVAWLVVTLASAVGGSGLYLIVRRGGRPLVDRFGRFVHLGPQQLDRAEGLIARGGWASIALGRALPGVRYATVIVCGLLKVPYPTYIVGHVVGSSAYVAIFLALGDIFGRTVLEWVHVPTHGLRLLWLLPLALGIPLLVVRAGRRVRSRQPEAPSRRRALGSVLAAGFIGAVAFAAALAATAAVAETLGAARPASAVGALLGWLVLGFELGTGVTVVLVYALLLALLVGLATTYNELVLPYVRPYAGSPAREVLVLALLAIGLIAAVFAPALLGDRGAWQAAGGPLMFVGLAFGVLVYATTAVYGRLLAVARVPSLGGRGGPATADEPG